MRYLIVPVLLVSFSAGAQSPVPTPTANEYRANADAAATDANPRAMFDAWLVSFNEHDAAEREQWLRDNTVLSEEQAKQYAEIDQQIKSGYGPFELVRVLRTDDLTIEVEARHVGSGKVARIEMTLDAERPNRIGKINMEPVEVKVNEGGMR